MNIEQFKKMCVRTIQREINIFDQKDYFNVQFEELLSDIQSSEKISGTVSISFAKGKSKQKHIIPICWRNGWGIGFENDVSFHSIKFITLLQNMYLDVALNQSSQQEVQSY
jgi:type 1 glutamine amidotransferase